MSNNETDNQEKGPESQAEGTSPTDQYLNWCIANANEHVRTDSYSVPAFHVRVDVPIDEIAEFMRAEGYEPTMARLHLLIREMRTSLEEDGGSYPAEDMDTHIISLACSRIAGLAEAGEFGE